MLLRMLPVVLLACDVGSEAPEAPEAPIAAGTIEGRVCHPESRTWAPDALVTAVGADGEVVVHTDADGRFTLANLPGASEQTVTIQVGDEAASTHVVWVGAGETVALPEPACLDAFDKDVLVITGTSGGAVAALAKAGVTTVTLLDGSDSAAVSALLDDGAALAAYDLVLFEGGFVEHRVIHDIGDPTNAAVAARMQNLRAFVAAGGIVFATDTAYDVVEIGWPDRAEFVGDDILPDGAQTGDTARLDADVEDESLLTFLGNASVHVEYAAAQWPPVITVSDDVTVLISGTVTFLEGQERYSLTRAPLLYRFPAGVGGVTYSTFALSADVDDSFVDMLRYTLHTR